MTRKGTLPGAAQAVLVPPPDPLLLCVAPEAPAALGEGAPFVPALAPIAPGKASVAPDVHAASESPSSTAPATRSSKRVFGSKTIDSSRRSQSTALGLRQFRCENRRAKVCLLGKAHHQLSITSERHDTTQAVSEATMIR